jgi:hypothetical protein
MPFGQPGFTLPDFTSFEVDREIVDYFSYFKKKFKKKQTLPKIVNRKYLVEYRINIVGKIVNLWLIHRSCCKVFFNAQEV